MKQAQSNQKMSKPQAAPSAAHAFVPAALMVRGRPKAKKIVRRAARRPTNLAPGADDASSAAPAAKAPASVVGVAAASKKKATAADYDAFMAEMAELGAIPTE
jgi:hypothetical protein